MRLAAALIFWLALSLVPAAPGEMPVLRIAVLKFGTVNWLTDTITHNELDVAEDYRLDVVPLAGKPATAIAFQAGDVDLIVTDWVWALRQRKAGADLRFAPYSVALGALMTRGGIDGICDLRGRSVGVVGGELDKNWLVMQALVRERCGFDLASETQALFGAPPLMSRQLEIGNVDAVSTYWHYAARLEAAGMTRLIDIAAAMKMLGISPAPPLIGFVWNADRGREGALTGFLRSVEAAGQLLASDDAQWDRLRPLMRAADDTEFGQLRDHYRAGIPGPWDAADTQAAARLYRLLAATGGAAFTFGAGRFDPAVFSPPGQSGNDEG